MPHHSVNSLMALSDRHVSVGCFHRFCKQPSISLLQLRQTPFYGRGMTPLREVASPECAGSCKRVDRCGVLWKLFPSGRSRLSKTKPTTQSKGLLWLACYCRFLSSKKAHLDSACVSLMLRAHSARWLYFTRFSSTNKLCLIVQPLSTMLRTILFWFCCAIIQSPTVRMDGLR